MATVVPTLLRTDLRGLLCRPSEQFDRAGVAVEAVGGGAEATAEDAAARDREFDRELQQVGVEEYFVAVDAADGVAVEPAALGASIN